MYHNYVHYFRSLMMQLLMTFNKVSDSFAFDYGTPAPELPAEKIKKALIEHEIYKDLGYVNYPKHMLQMNFDVHHLQLGTKIPDTAAIVPPDTVNYTHYDNDAWYALLMVGLDFPATKDTPYKAPYQHWAVGGIHEDQFLSGECLINYEWTAAPYKKDHSEFSIPVNIIIPCIIRDYDLLHIGKHRVVFLLYREPDKEELWKNWEYNIEVPRTYFNTTKFSTKYRLGDPVAVNFFIADIKEDHKSRPIEASPHDC